MVYVEMVKKEKQNCCGCFACKNICPQKCITMKADEEGFLYPMVKQEMCIHCGACDKVCPIETNLHLRENDEILSFEMKAYFAYNRSTKIREDSSSGGLFTLLAENVLSLGGIVYGATMSDDCMHVQQVAITDKGKLKKLRGSKYIQSEMNECFLEIRTLLENNQIILFTGTPCQIEGLQAFLGKKYSNLICVDIICHGVPSQKVWEKYLKDLERKNKSNAREVLFRNKNLGWRMYSIFVSFKNGKSYQKVFKEDLFGLAFLQNICLRPSCYECVFKKINRKSDITLADAWSNNNVLKDDDKGMSLVLVHSEKGQKIINSIKKNLVFANVPVEDVIKGNAPLYSSAVPHPERETFFEELDVLPIDKLLKKHVNNKKSLKWKFRHLYKKILYINPLKRNRENSR